MPVQQHHSPVPSRGISPVSSVLTLYTIKLNRYFDQNSIERYKIFVNIYCIVEEGYNKTKYLNDVIFGTDDVLRHAYIDSSGDTADISGRSVQQWTVIRNRFGILNCVLNDIVEVIR